MDKRLGQVALPLAGAAGAGANGKPAVQETEYPSVSSGFGKLLRHYRVAAGLSQEALAERARMSSFAISALERGHRRKPQSKTLALLAEALELDASQRAEFEAAARQAHPRDGVTIARWSGVSTAGPIPNNLPRQLTPLIGRENELAEVASLVDAHPLTTLAGAGGVGKTRLALRIGELLLEGSWDGVWLVELAASEESTSSLHALASTFGLREQPARPLLDVVLQYLHARRFVLIIDNCEHVIEETARLVDVILRKTQSIRILATSREPLSVAAEHVYRVPPLAVPPRTPTSAKESARYDAVALFTERAQAADAAFRLTDDTAPTVAEICSRLDGIPLAIELAAARTRVLSLTEIAERLDRRFSVLIGSGRAATARQQTLRALIDWSYDLLPEREKNVFRSLGVFPGDFFLDIVPRLHEDVPDASDTLASLVEKSLVHAETIRGRTRFRLLESMRAYAHEQLVARGELDAALLAHARAYLALAERLESRWDATPDVEWKLEAEPELENWRAALRWAFAPGGDLGIALRLTVALRPVWFTSAPAEGLTWVRRGLDASDESRPNRLRAWLDLSAAHLTMVMQQYADAAASAQRALAAFSALDEPHGRALSRLFAGAARGMLGEAAEAKADLRVALDECRALGAHRAVAAALLYLAALELESGEAAPARSLFTEALRLFKALGASRPAAHIALNLAELEFKYGDATGASRLAREALEADAALNDLDAVAYDLCNLAAYDGALGDWEASETHAREALTLARERSITSAGAWAIQHLAAVAALRPEPDAMLRAEQLRRAVCLVGFVDARVAEYGLYRDFAEVREREQILAAARASLGSETDALIEEGSTWTEARAFEETSLV